eukprot:1359066-Pleurochrysis_carterae.AAC.1
MPNDAWALSDARTARRTGRRRGGKTSKRRQADGLAAGVAERRPSVGRRTLDRIVARKADIGRGTWDMGHRT